MKTKILLMSITVASCLLTSCGPKTCSTHNLDYRGICSSCGTNVSAKAQFDCSIDYQTEWSSGSVNVVNGKAYIHGILENKRSLNYYLNLSVNFEEGTLSPQKPPCFEEVKLYYGEGNEVSLNYSIVDYGFDSQFWSAANYMEEEQVDFYYVLTPLNKTLTTINFTYAIQNNCLTVAFEGIAL